MINNNQLTISENNRYFLHTPIQCIDENEKMQTQSVLIDNISDNSLWNANTEKLKCSLLSSSAQQYTNINQISAAKKGASLSSANKEQCRSVSVYADKTKKNIISGYITLDDYKNLDPVAVLNSPGSASNGSPGASPGSSPSASPSASPGASPGASPEKSLGESLNPSPGGSTTETFSTLTNETDLLKTNAFHKIKNDSIVRFYFISLLVIFIYIIYRICKKML